MSTESKKAAPAIKPDQVYFNVPETAEFLRVSKKTVSRAVSKQALPHIRVGRRIIFERSDLMAFMQSKKVSGTKQSIHITRRKFLKSVNKKVRGQ